MVKKFQLSNIILFIILTLMCACSSTPKEKGVHAQMFLKVPLDTIGAIECFAEGKHYGILPVTEQTFYPGDDSFHKMHHHGFALENKWMAYRLYFDKRQIVDIYAKKTPQLEIAQSLWYPNDEQLEAGFGDDILKVGSTIGVGAVRPYDYEKGKLVNMDKFVSRTQRIVSVENDKAVAEIDVKGLQIEDKVVELITRYTVFADHRGLLCEVFSSDELKTLVTGVQYVGEPLTTQVATDEDIILASWGTSWPVNDTIKYPMETVGLAVAVPKMYIGTEQHIAVNSLVSRDSDCSEKEDSYIFADNLQILAPLVLTRLDNGQYYCQFQLTAMGLKENTPPATTPEEFFHSLTNKELW